MDQNNRNQKIVPQEIRRQASIPSPSKPSQPVPQQIFNLNEIRQQEIWDESHQAIFQAVVHTEDKLKQYYNEITHSDDQFMQKLHTTNFFNELKNINEQLNDQKKYINFIPELDDLFTKIRGHLIKKDPNMTTKGEFLHFVETTFQIQQENFNFIQQIQQ